MRKIILIIVLFRVPMTGRRLTYILLFISTFCFAQNWIWTKTFGSSGGDVGYSIAVDALDNVYTIGNFNGTVDFDPGPTVYTLTSAGAEDVFVSKLDASGNFLWAKRFGSVHSDEGHGIAIDGNNNVYVTGYFFATVDFDPGVGVYTLTAPGGGYDIFVSKFDASGSFLWAKSMGGNVVDDLGYSIAVDGSGNVYTTGGFASTGDFDPGPGVYNLTSSVTAATDIFVSKLDPSGNFLWAKSMGGDNGDFGKSIAVDATGNAFITGYFSTTSDFDPGAGTFNLTTSGNRDVFVMKLDPSGNFIWAKSMGGVNDDDAESIAVDASGNVFTCGNYKGTADFDPSVSTFSFSSAGLDDIFISKLNSAGSFVWAKSIGGTSYDYAYSVALDASGNVYSTGQFCYSVDFDPGLGVNTHTSDGPPDLFLLKLDNSGGFAAAEDIGSNSTEVGRSIFVDAAGNVHTTGYFEGVVDFDTGPAVSTFTSNGDIDAFVLKLSNIAIGVKEQSNSIKPICIYPNPNDGIFKIQIDTDIKNCELILINTVGQKVYEQKILLGTNEIKSNGLSIGLYNCILVQDNQQINSVKLIIK